jgi:signal transduction histidine kinase
MKAPAALRTRLFLNTLIILGLGMSLVALLSWSAVEAVYLDNQRENLLAQASLTAAALQGRSLPDGATQPYLQTTNLTPGIHTRLLAEQGAVILNLPLSPGDDLTLPAEDSSVISPQELLARPEIAQAMQGLAATAVRSVSGRRVLYAAAPVLGADGGVSGLVYLAMPLPASGLPLNLALGLMGAALAAGILALIAGSLLARRIIAPVEEISSAAAAVSVGDLHQSVPAESGIRELNALGHSFNAMTASLRQSEQAKNAFVADVTHELRTPLTVIQGTIETLQDGAVDDVAGRGALLDSMQRETERLTRLVNDLLVLARADAGTLNMDIQPLDLVELARIRCEHLAGLAARRQVRLEVIGAESAEVLGDADRLAQVLDNLLDNAIRYSPENSSVTVEIQSDANECQCAVRDRGAGIPEKHLPLIFDRFYRADASRNRQSGGAGLGLAIVRALVAAQGGRIRAESAPGCGTTLRFWLPAASGLTAV